jgi:hypothetical protein
MQLQQREVVLFRDFQTKLRKCQDLFTNRGNNNTAR